MATEVSIAIRKAEAQERVNKAAHALAKAKGVEAVDLAPAHKDPLIQGAVQVEALADFLESIAGVGGTVPEGNAKDAAQAQGEATRLAEKLDTAEPNVFDQMREAIKAIPTEPKTTRGSRGGK